MLNIDNKKTIKVDYSEWVNIYKETILSILDKKSLVMNDIHLKECYEQNMDAQWSALIDIQEHIKSFTYNEWHIYVDFVLKLIVQKDSKDIEDLPYYDLWDRHYNPLIVSIYAVFNSGEDLTNSNLPKNAQIIWKSSKHHDKIKREISKILKTW